MAAVSFDRSGSPFPILEGPQFVVQLSPNFGWSDLCEVLRGYIKEVKDQWVKESEIPPKIVAFCEEMEGWLDDPSSKDLNTLKSLDFWVKKVDDQLNDTPDLPEILVKPCSQSN